MMCGSHIDAEVVDQWMKFKDLQQAPALESLCCLRIDIFGIYNSNHHDLGRNVVYCSLFRRNNGYFELRSLQISYDSYEFEH